jgi:hypothetical protein
MGNEHSAIVVGRGFAGAPVVELRRLATSATVPGNGTGPRGLGGRVT